MAEAIRVAPSTLRMQYGDVRQIQIISDYKKNIKVEMTPKNILEWDANHHELKAISNGSVRLTWTCYDDKGNLKGTYHTSAIVSKYDTSENVRFMWHNRNTNRLTTIHSKGLESLYFYLPKKSGTLLVDTEQELGGTFAAPTILYPTEKHFYDKDLTQPVLDNFDGTIILKEYSGLLDVHSTYWEFAYDAEFTNIIKRETLTRDYGHDIFKNTTSFYGITTYVRVRYHETTLNSSWSDTIKISWTRYTTEGISNNVVKGNNVDGAYYGSLSNSATISNRDYRGNFDTLVTNGLGTFKVGQQVSKDGELYYCHTAGTVSASNPFENVFKKETDFLPGYDWLCNKVGVGVNVGNGNLDTYATTNVNRGSYYADSLSFQAWLKFIQNGKVLIVPNEHVWSNFCWNDLAKRDLVYGNKTIRIGTKLYKLRLPTSDEDNNLFTLSEASSKTINKINNNGIYFLRNSFDTIIYPKRRLSTFLRKNDGSYTLEDLYIDSNVINANIKWIPVLELIREDYTPTTVYYLEDVVQRDGTTTSELKSAVFGNTGISDAPYTKLPKCCKADNENFQYDRWTDTGYFGKVSDTNTSFISNEKLMNTIGWTAGTVYTTNVGYYKFYFHGMVLYFTRKPLRYGTQGTMWMSLINNATNANYISDMSSTTTTNKGKQNITIDGTTYVPFNMSGVRVYPRGTAVTAANGTDNIMEDTHWSLFWRITAGYMTNTTNGGWYANGGKQVGDNWAEEARSILDIVPHNYCFYFQEVPYGSYSNSSYPYAMNMTGYGSGGGTGCCIIGLVVRTWSYD